MSIKELDIEWNGRTEKARFTKAGKRLWVHVAGETFAYSAKSAGSRKAGASFQPGPQKSPMPGKIMKINFGQGDIVDAKKTVVILEAMKMEYSIRMPEKVKVKAIHVEVGEQVKEGQILFEVEKA